MNRIKNILLLIVLLLTVHNWAFSQDQKVIKGKVTEKGSGEPMIGVNVVERNQNERFLNGTITDMNGNFMLMVSSDTETELLFSFIGYDNVTVPITDQEEVNVEMNFQSQQLSDFVVTASVIEDMGIESISKRDMTGTSSSVDMKDLEGTPVTSVEDAIQGRVSGVLAVAFSGDPGSGMQVRVRGESSLTSGNDPLYVVDGMPVISESNNSFSSIPTSPLADIPPEEIESIEVLKDASAVALWGTRAANGVVIIRTKRGERNKTTVQFSSRVSLKIPKARVPMLSGDAYKTLMNEADQNRGGDTYHDEVITNLRDNVQNSDYELHNNNTNWVDAIENYGTIQNYSFNLSGGGNSVRYRFSTSYEDNRGPIITTKYQRLNTTFNLDYQISKKMSMASNINYTNSSLDQKDISGGSNVIPSSIQGTALTRAPTWPIYLQDAQGNTLDNQLAFQDLLVANDYTATNPYAFLLNKDNNRKSNRLYGTVKLSLRPVDHLRLQANIGGDFSADNNSFFIPPTSTGAEPGEELYNNMQLYDSDRFKLYGRFTANYIRSYNDRHTINLTAFTSVDMNNSSSMSAGGNNIASYKTPTLSTAASYAGGSPLGSGFSEGILTSTGGRAHYKFMDRYIISGAFIMDGSSKFGPENRYAYLPSVSGKWLLSEEFFLEDVAWINELALRYSYGLNGNGGISNYTYFSRYSSSSQNNYLGIGGIQSNNIRLDNIKWETTAQHNAGISGLFFDEKLEFELYYFDKYTNDLLQKNYQLPTTSGFGTLNWYNTGDVRNRGVEFEMNYDIINKKDWSWSIGGNVSSLVNSIEKLPPNSTYEGIDTKSGGYRWQLILGDPLGSFYGYKYKGVYAYDADAVVRNGSGDIVYNLGGYDEDVPFNNAKIMSYNNFLFEGGDAIYEDMNKDGVIDELDVVKIGDVNPDLYGGFNSTVRYKSFTLNLFFQYMYGNDLINKARMSVESMNSLNNQSVAVQRRWRKQGDETDIPKAAHNYKSGINYLASDRFIEDGSYLRLKSLQLSYFMSRDIAKKLHIRSGRFFFTATNLLTFTNYTGQDPEVNGKGSMLRGIDNSLTAQPVILTIGTSIKF